MTNKDKADTFRKIAKAFRAWGKLGPGNTKETCKAAVAAFTLAINNLPLINAAKSAYWFPHKALYNVTEQFSEMAAPGCNLEKYLGNYGRMTQKQLPGVISFPMVLEFWATELEKAASVDCGHAEPDKGGQTPEVADNEADDGPQTPAVDPKPTLSKEALAIAVLVDHPDWTNIQIAEAAGCHEKTLYTFQSFKNAREVLRQTTKASIPKGSKSKDGEMEAWE